MTSYLLLVDVCLSLNSTEMESFENHVGVVASPLLLCESKKKESPR